MPLTREFKQTIQARVQRDAAFRRELLRESVECFVLGDIETGKAVLRDYINATIGFAELAEATGHSAKSLMRMLSPSGNPQARNLFEIVEYLQRKERVRLKLPQPRGSLVVCAVNCRALLGRERARRPCTVIVVIGRPRYSEAAGEF